MAYRTISTVLDSHAYMDKTTKQAATRSYVCRDAYW
jgi:hypothetical protein